MSDSQDDINLSKYFVWIAWLLAFALLIFVFQDYLDQQWNPNAEPDYMLSSDGKAEVHLQQNRQGHYLTTGTINEAKVIFLLDTGATNVSVPAHIANKLGLKRYSAHIAQTANGAVKVYATKIQQLRIGNIFLYDVAASINPGMKSDEILLGMSALKKVEFSQSGKQLTLREQ